MRYEHKNNQLQETEQLASMYTENSSSDIHFYLCRFL